MTQLFRTIALLLIGSIWTTSVEGGTTCLCDRPSDLLDKDSRTIHVPCRRGKCVLPAHTLHPACGIYREIQSDANGRSTINEFRQCAQIWTDEQRHEREVVVAWTKQSTIRIYHKCTPDDCNANFSVTSNDWFPREFADAFERCVPRTFRRLQRRLQPRRLLSDVLACECDERREPMLGFEDSPSCSKEHRCDSSNETNPYERQYRVCGQSRTNFGCVHMKKMNWKQAAHDFMAAVVYVKEDDYFYGCRHTDLCNARFELAAKFSVADVVCQWVCPDLKLKKLTFDWWHFAIVVTTLIGLVTYLVYVCVFDIGWTLIVIV